MKMYYAGNRIDGKVLSANGKLYVPIEIISKKLGINVKLDADKKSITFQDSTSISELTKTIDDLTSKN